MEEVNVSVTKSKSSSGCLIVKKKPEGSSSGGVGSSGGQQLRGYEVTNNKKRPRAVNSESSSSDGEGDDDDGLMELYRRREASGTAGDGGGSIVYTRKGREAERKRSKLDVYDFDEYDDLTDVEMMGKMYFDGVEGSGRSFLGMNPAVKGGGRNEFKSVSSRHNGVYRTKNSFLDNSSNGRGNSLLKNRFDRKTKVLGSTMKKSYGSGDDAIRLQGKNGVLKVMVNNKKKANVPFVAQHRQEVGRNSMSPGSRETTPNKVIVASPSFVKNQVLHRSKTLDASEKDKAKSHKVSPVNSYETSDESLEDSDTPSKNLQTRVGMSTKRARSEARDTLSPDMLQPKKTKAGKLKRGSGTEKQLLREKIRNILVSSGWTIDYRPRRNRDYCDAVYVNPTGTAYWSIIKAYDAYQKQLEDEGAEDVGDCSSVTPISADMLSKLTRQTQKKIEKELKRKKRDDARSSKRKKGATAGKPVSDEDDTGSSDSDRQGEKLSSAKVMQGRVVKFPSAANPLSINGRKSKKIGRCTLLARNSEKGLSSASDGFVPYKGKRNLLSWLIDSGIVELSEKVRYMNRKQSRVMLQGWVTRDGIHCGCCSKILTVSKFEVHAASKLRQPFQNIHLSSGPSLLQCMLDAWNRQHESHRRVFQAIDVDGDDPNDDTCGICGDGGDLICCDGCPSTFHQSCLDIEILPPGDWHCPHCSCKFCGIAEPTSVEGNESAFSSLCLCTLCQRKYHRSCLQEMDVASVRSTSPSMPFCGWKCRELFEQVQKLLGIKHDLEAGFSWSLIHCTDLEADSSLRGFSHRVEWNAKLAVTQTVMDECFLPIIDRRSGINLIHNVVYNCGSNFHRLNYSGFYTAILERGDEIISAASIRIHGAQLAEMPYIGTRHIYRRQGMFRRLFSALESALRSLKVEKLIIPAISELMDTWTTVFGFNALDDSHKKDMKSVNMLVFPGTDMLQKKLVEPESPNQDHAACNGTVSLKVDTDMPDSNDISGGDPSPGNDTTVVLKNDDTISSSTVSGLQDHAASLNDVSVLGPLDTSEEAEPPQTGEGNQGTSGSVSEIDNKFSQSVLDGMVYYPSDVSTEIPEPRKSSIGSSSKQDIQGSADVKKDATEEKQGDIPDLGLPPLCVSSHNNSAESPLNQNAVGSSLLDALATQRLSVGEGAAQSVLTLEENCEPPFDARHSTSSTASPDTLDDKADDDDVQQPSGDGQVQRVADDNGSGSKTDDLTLDNGSNTDQHIDIPLGSELNVSNEDSMDSHARRSEKLAAPHAVVIGGSPPCEIYHPVLDMEQSRLDLCAHEDEKNLNGEVGETAHFSDCASGLPSQNMEMKAEQND
ncbi:hypothetical protein Dimus_001634 [Dionaea muscipula]